jgi:rhodanese-related sulfurtransferase
MIDPAGLNKVLETDPCAVLIDVRTPGEFGRVHVRGAKNVPLDDLSAEAVKRHLSNGTNRVYVVCQGGTRSKQACEKLASSQLDLVDVQGGTAACVSAGLPVVRGRGVIPVDRQMRIVAGSMVLIGAVLGTWLHPAWYGLCAFVGAGLVFAGATDICPMIGMLRAMPWNRGSSATCSAG